MLPFYHGDLRFAYYQNQPVYRVNPCSERKRNLPHKTLNPARLYCRYTVVSRQMRGRIVSLANEEDDMAAPQLRIFLGSDEDGVAIEPARTEKQNVTVSLSEVFPLLADAVNSERTWLKDFADDEISISQDLYEVVLAYQHYRRPSA